MSWKLIFGLSFFGLLMGLGTAFVIPPGIEPHLWVGIFLLSALIIAKRAPGQYFLHGLCVSVLNSVWVTAAHVGLYDHYAVLHGRFISMAPPVGSTQMTVAVAGAVVGIVMGIVLGMVAWVSSKFVVSSHSEFAGW
jgi:hypothetical protein